MVDDCRCAHSRHANQTWTGADCYVGVTGASRGLGQAICIELVKALSSTDDPAASLTILLISRDENGMKTTEAKIHSSKHPDSQMELHVLISPTYLDMSLANEELLQKTLQPLFEKSLRMPACRPRWNLLVHNAATLGSIQLRADERLDIDYLTDYYHTNLTSMITLTGVFLKHFAPSHLPTHHPTTIANISSLAAIKPLLLMSDYCVGKAAREMYLRCLSVDRPSIALINYAPGPLDTDMYDTLIDKHGDEESRALHARNKQTGKLIHPNDSARVFVELLKRQVRPGLADGAKTMRPDIFHCPTHQPQLTGLWQGAHIDYYDVINCVNK